MHPLDNPIWHTLCTRHQALAETGDGWRRYAADHAPFLGVAAADTPITDALAPGDARLLLGVIPDAPAGWTCRRFPNLAQMACEQAPTIPPGPPIATLTEDDRAQVLALTALVYPHYFRPNTMRLGRYFGIWEDGRLAAMIGERLGPAGTREMSAICTHPDFLGRGYARRLTAWLTARTQFEGNLPFLHVSYQNTRALTLYQQLGYRVRLDIAFAELSRPS